MPVLPLEGLAIEVVVKSILLFIMGSSPSSESLGQTKSQLEQYLAPNVWRKMATTVLKQIQDPASFVFLRSLPSIFQLIIGRHSSSLCLSCEEDSDQCKFCCSGLRWMDLIRAFATNTKYCDCFRCTKIVQQVSEASRNRAERMNGILAYACWSYGTYIKQLHVNSISDTLIKNLKLLPNLQSLAVTGVGEIERRRFSNNFEDFVRTLKAHCKNIKTISLSCELKSVDVSHLTKLQTLTCLLLDLPGLSHYAAAKVICKLPTLKHFGWKNGNEYLNFDKLLDILHDICLHQPTCDEKLCQWLSPVNVRELRPGTMQNVFSDEVPFEPAGLFFLNDIQMVGNFGKIYNLYCDCTRLPTLLPFFSNLNLSRDNISVIELTLQEMVLNTEDILSLIKYCPGLRSLSIVGSVIEALVMPTRDDLVLTSLKNFTFLPVVLSEIHKYNILALIEVLLRRAIHIERIHIDLGSLKMDDLLFALVFPKNRNCLKTFYLEGTKLELSSESLNRAVHTSEGCMEIGYVNLWSGELSRWQTSQEMQRCMRKNKKKIAFKECRERRLDCITEMGFQNLNVIE